MPYLAVSYNTKSIIEKALQEPTDKCIEQTINTQITRTEDKIYAARFLDTLASLYQKKLNENTIIGKREKNNCVSARNSRDPLVQMKVGIQDYRNMRGAHLNSLFNQLDPQAGPIYQAPDQVFEQELLKAQKIGNDLLLRAQIARRAISLTPEEQAKLYPSLASLYKEQVNARKWYQHGACAIALGVLLLPLAPLVYYVWKKSRDKEVIQPNRRTEEERHTIRTNRMAFKEIVNNTREGKGTFVTEKDVRNKQAREYVTKDKKDRDTYFLKHRFIHFDGILGSKVTASQINEITASRKNDTELRLSLGMH